MLPSPYSTIAISLIVHLRPTGSGSSCLLHPETLLFSGGPCGGPPTIDFQIKRLVPKHIGKIPPGGDGNNR
jgi:hypothetical protein